MKHTNIYINEDLCESSVNARKVQLPDLKRARAEGKIAYFNHTKLVILERGERTSQVQTVLPNPGSSVVTVTPAVTLAGAAVPVGADAAYDAASGAAGSGTHDANCTDVNQRDGTIGHRSS